MVWVVTVPPPEEGARRGEHGLGSDVNCLLAPLDGRDIPEASVPPEVCVKCGAYQVEVQGRRLCPLCADIAPDSYISCEQFVERMAVVGAQNGLQDYRRVLIAVDSALLQPNCHDLVSLVFETLDAIPDCVIVSFVVFDHHLRLLRLSEGREGVVVVDVLPGGSPLPASFQPETYCIPAGILRQQREGLVRILTSGTLSGGARTLQATHYPVLEDILDLTLFLRMRCSQSCNAQVLCFTTKALTLRATDASPALRKTCDALSVTVAATAHSRNLSLDVFDALGYLYLHHKTSLVTLCLGHRCLNFPQLLHVCGASGGTMLRAETPTEEGITSTLIKEVKAFCGTVPGEFGSGLVNTDVDGTLATIEVRAAGLDLDRITGPVLPDVAVLALSPLSVRSAFVSSAGDPLRMYSSTDASLRLRTAGDLCVDPDHIQAMHHAPLIAYANESVTVCGVLPSGLAATPECVLTLQLRPTSPPKTSGAWGALMPWTRKVQAAARPVVQCVVRKATLVATVNATGKVLQLQRVKVTRVFTAALPLGPATLSLPRVLPPPSAPSSSASVAMEADEFDACAWALVVARGAAADFHLAVGPLSVAVYGASGSGDFAETPVPAATIETSARDEEHNLRAKHLRAMDKVVKGLLKAWPQAAHDATKLAVLRMLFHLREGSLLNGPCTNTMDGYLERARFLGGSLALSLRLVVPAVTLDTRGLPASHRAAVHTGSSYCRGTYAEGEWLVGMPPETCALLPGTLSLVDLGSTLLLFSAAAPPGHAYVAPEPSSSPLMGLAREIQAARWPTPRLYQLSSGQHDTYKRLVFTHLSPAHMAPQDVLMRYIHTFAPALVDQEAVEGLLRAFPYTDELFFAKFVQLTAPKLSALLQGLSIPLRPPTRTAPIAVMTMQRTPVAPVALPASAVPRVGGDAAADSV